MGQGKNNRKKRNNQAENGNGQVHQQSDEAKELRKKIKEEGDNKLEEYGQVILEDNRRQRRIHLTMIVGEVGGHENSSGSSRTTKYDHILPKLAEIEDDSSVDGFLVPLNTSGGDVSAGLAIVEMIAPLSLSAVSLVLDGSHSIGVPLVVSTSYSFIVPSDIMMIHPVWMTGVVIGVSRTYEYFEMIQDRIFTFVPNYVDVACDRLRELMHNIKMLTRDLGAVLVGTQAVEAGLIDQMGGIKEALGKLYTMIDDQERRRQIPSFEIICLNFSLKCDII